MPTKLYYKQKYDQYKQLLDTRLSQNVLQGMYDDVIQDYHEGYTRGELCTKYKLTYLKLKIILRNQHSSKIPIADINNIKINLQNKIITKREVMNTYKISYRALNNLLCSVTPSGAANDSISCDRQLLLQS
ncbi:hypothetical protein PROFUN_16959 [Planoprotostelium fungivorum]|uniref:Uncharacterized protein n=1 Tax=Planoprotostelium fungivorum TaxID=1890364 RepID=A0A2P6MMJ5_9EUKA|nr:hypothetical protein PROFUN_16959 [Planoprotostelium fungivorum]